MDKISKTERYKDIYQRANKKQYEKNKALLNLCKMFQKNEISKDQFCDAILGLNTETPDSIK